MATLQPWNIRIGQVGPPVLPPLDQVENPAPPPLQTPHPRWPFENLAFEGGGAKGIAYVGAVQVLEEEGLYPQHVLRVSGTSSGSFLAAMLAVGCPAKDLAGLLFETDIAAVMRDARWGMVSGLVNMVTVFGWNPGEKLLAFLGDRLRERTGSEDVTFRQVLERSGRELCVPVTNLTRMCTEYCHPKTTPDMPVRLAVGMSMSLPVLMAPYRLVRPDKAGGSDLYTDGGLLCNYPVHAFDGWWLSMHPDDTFLNRLRPLDRVVEQMHDQVRFLPRNPRTLGLTVFDRAELDASERWLTAEGRPPARPDTRLARECAVGEARLAQLRALRAELDGAAQRLVDALAAVERDGDGAVCRDEIRQLFDVGTLTAEDARLLFGRTDLDGIFAALDRNGDGAIRYDELLRYIDARNVELTAHLGLAHKEPRSMTSFVSTVFNTLLMHLRRVTLHPEDRFRTLPIDTDYVGTADFDLEPDDRAFLLESGRRAAKAFLAGVEARKAP
ncbi:MAG: patatin-like phospholipase family protein [Bryobacterales bacterium]